MGSLLPPARLTVTLALLMLASCATPRLEEIVCVTDPLDPLRIICTTKTTHPRVGGL